MKFRFLCLAAGAVYLHAASPLIEQRLNDLRAHPHELYGFLYRMPKGGDLHNHLSGAVYAESYIRTAAANGLCVDTKAFIFFLAKPEAAKPCGDGMEATRAQNDNVIFNGLIDSLSMRNFVAGRESAHDHFFATFRKFGAPKLEQRVAFLTEVLHRAAEQNESYIETMAINGSLANPAGIKAGFDGDFDSTRAKLMQAGLENVIKDMRGRIEGLEQGRMAAFHCDTQAQSVDCRVTPRYIFEVTRESPKEQVFAQILAGMMLCAMDPRVVAINLVQPEDGVVSMRDYGLHMRMVQYARKLYPKIHVTLHAGELAPGLVPTDALRFHIREAVEVASADRIGHGVDIGYETDSYELLEQMKQRKIPVEINLTSNDQILGVRGGEHPFPLYRKHGVPVVLSTDDEGVARTSLTEEYLRAVVNYNLSYADLKQIVRNGLQFAFVGGDSYWKDHSYRSPVTACAGSVKAKACQDFLKTSEKARLQVDLEERFRVFEAWVIAHP